MSNNITDQWNIGPPDLKKIDLVFYVVINYLGVILNFILIRNILKASTKTSREIFVIGLSSACLFLSASCATQCLFNYISPDYSYQFGDIGCFVEAYLHVSFIMVQFFSIVMISWSSYEAVIYRKGISLLRAIVCLVFIWLVSSIGTYIIGHYSDVILVPSGVYCFYDFDSPILYAWLTPIMLISLFLTVFFYFRVFNFTKLTIQITSANTRGSHVVTRKVRLRSLMFVVGYFLGWFPVVIVCFYSLHYGAVTPGLDTFLAISGSLHSIWQPLIYGFHQRSCQKRLSRIYCCNPVHSNEIIDITPSPAGVKNSKGGVPDSPRINPKRSSGGSIPILSLPVGDCDQYSPDTLQLPRVGWKEMIASPTRSPERARTTTDEKN